MGIIYITRHGETEWNAQQRIQGHTDVPLSERGRAQAQMLARRLADVPIDAVYSSDLRRAADTARALLAGRNAPPPLTLAPELREYHKGIFEGLTPDECEQRHPEIYAASLVNDLDFTPPGGETVRQTAARIHAIVQQVRRAHPDQTVLIVGHGGSLRAALVSLLELPPQANWKFVMHNCSLTIIHTYPDNAVLHLYNDTSHISGAVRAY